MSFQLVDFILNCPAVPRMEKWHRGRRSHILRASSFLLESINTLLKTALYKYCEGKCRTRNTLGCTVKNMKDVLMTRSYVISLMLPLRLLPSLFLTKPQTHSGWYDRRWYRDAGVHGTWLCVTKKFYFAKNFACVIRQNDSFLVSHHKWTLFASVCLFVMFYPYIFALSSRWGLRFAIYGRAPSFSRRLTFSTLSLYGKNIWSIWSSETVLSKSVRVKVNYRLDSISSISYGI